MAARTSAGIRRSLSLLRIIKRSSIRPFFRMGSRLATATVRQYPAVCILPNDGNPHAQPHQTS
ncbi:Hypothetical protein GbCGDNIH3_7270 [Granulibacter bethesdensis]|uniref:Uncharacterized protein n=1 Tax=Granulibacter bethesdensis TaxID=364410 RepID=A0AAN0REN0_9PROT|nr:Hypothetical protein GbCGDNIH3_7270 [Granulibacter bethesdensis]